MRHRETGPAQATVEPLRQDAQLVVTTDAHLPLRAFALVQDVADTYAGIGVLEEADEDAVLVALHRDETPVPSKWRGVVAHRRDEATIFGERLADGGNELLYAFLIRKMRQRIAHAKHELR